MTRTCCYYTCSWHKGRASMKRNKQQRPYSLLFDLRSHRELRLRMVTIIPARTAVNVRKIFIYTLYLYIFITVKTAPHLNRLSRTAQPAVTIRSLRVVVMRCRTGHIWKKVTSKIFLFLQKQIHFFFCLRETESIVLVLLLEKKNLKYSSSKFYFIFIYFLL